jgi:hypothetical protein
MRCITKMLFVILMVPFSSCALFRSNPPQPLISSLASVAGQWKGKAKRPSEFWSDGDVKVSIASSGSYVVTLRGATSFLIMT